MPSEFQRNLNDNYASFAARQSLFSRLRLDPVLLVLLFALAVYGLVVLYSASGADMGRVVRQAVYLGIAFSAMFVVAQFSMKTVNALSPIGYLVGILLLLSVFVAGVEVNGSVRWVDVFGLVRFQPSELMKIVVPLTLAAYLSRAPSPPALGTLAVAFGLALLPFGLIVIQPDLGTSLLIFASGVLVIWLAGLSWTVIVVGLSALALAAWPIWTFLLQGYQRQRILTLLNPEADRLGAGWNIIQSKTAIGSGGWSGKGWQNGTQSQLDFLPESHTDFIIAVLAEEFGLLGVMLLLLLYLLLVVRGAYIAARSKDAFSRLVVGSLSLTLFVYVVVNMGMVSGILPVVGVPLPLISYGGTAMVTMIASFGFMMAAYSESQL